MYTARILIAVIVMCYMHFLLLLTYVLIMACTHVHLITGPYTSMRASRLHVRVHAAGQHVLHLSTLHAHKI